jgi:hypothetical protein
MFPTSPVSVNACEAGAVAMALGVVVIMGSHPAIPIDMDSLQVSRLDLRRSGTHTSWT